jgi:hypothetical protein
MPIKHLTSAVAPAGQRISRRLPVLIGSLALLGSVGAVVAVAAVTGSNERILPVSGTAGNRPSSTTPPEAATSSYPTNASGETYGSSAEAQTAGEEPDLVLAIGKTRSGEIVHGYVRKSELNAAATGADVKTPAEATEYSHAAERRAATTIPLYAQDGSTVIGSYTMPAYTPPPAPANSAHSTKP